MNNAIFSQERPQNEHTLSYAPGCKERKSLNEKSDQAYMTVGLKDNNLFCTRAQIRHLTASYPILQD